ncbi:MAG: hypothetical protein IJX14_01885, partial [Clostridia bacterium]|nr:hypothetical protein [Clostridia bacterium]
MRYCIRETHRNQPGDWSEVSLHDCIVTEIRQEGDTLVFVLPKGISVFSHASINHSGRHLQSGRTELRLIGVQGTHTGIGQSFEVIDHLYAPADGYFALSMIPQTPDSDGHTRSYEFPCAAVEYCFDEFTGDSWHQELEDEKMESLAKKIRQGHGFAVSALQKLLPKRKEDCADILITAMTHDQRYDHQCDPDRAEYLMRLLDLFPEPEKERITAAVLAEHRRMVDGEYHDFTQFVSLLRLWRDRGNTQVEAILQEAGNTLRQALDSRVEEPIGPDDLQDKYRYLCPETAPEYAMPQTGTPPEHSIQSILEAARDPAKPVFHHTMYRKFLRTLPPEQIQFLADTADIEPDREAKARLYSLFAALPYPNDPTEMCTIAAERIPALTGSFSDLDLTARRLFITANDLFHALGQLRHPAVRELGIRLVREAMAGKKYLYDHAMALFGRNYTESDEDFDLLCDFLDSIGPYDENFDLYHSVEMTMMKYLYR